MNSLRNVLLLSGILSVCWGIPTAYSIPERVAELNSPDYEAKTKFRLRNGESRNFTFLATATILPEPAGAVTGIEYWSEKQMVEDDPWLIAKFCRMWWSFPVVQISLSLEEEGHSGVQVRVKWFQRCAVFFCDRPDFGDIVFDYERGTRNCNTGQGWILHRSYQ